MCTVSVQIIIQSSRILSQDIKYLKNKHNASSTETLHNIDMTTFPIIAMVFSIGKIWFFAILKKCNDFDKVSKGILFILSYSNKHPSVNVLNADNRNDVISGIVALTCGLISIVLVIYYQ